MTKILVADDLGDEGMSMLRESGEVTLQTGMDEAALRAALPGYQVLVVRSATTVTAKSLELADSLAVVGRAGIGVDNIDVAACTARGIAVMNTPEANTVTTAEHAVAHYGAGALLADPRCPGGVLARLRVASMASGGEQAVGGLFVDFEPSRTVASRRGPNSLKIEKETTHDLV